MARLARSSVDIATKFLRLTDATLITDLSLYDDIAYAYSMEYCGLTEESYTVLTDTKKQLFQSANAQLIVFYWNQSDKYGKKTESHEFGSFEVTMDIPESIRKQLNMFKEMVIGG